MIVEGFNANDIKPSATSACTRSSSTTTSAASTAPTSATTRPRPWRPGRPPPTSGTPATSRINADGTVTATPDRVRRHQPDLVRPHQARQQGRVRRAHHRAARRAPGRGRTRCAPRHGQHHRRPKRGFREFVVLFQNDVNMRTDQSLGRRSTAASAAERLAGREPGCMEDPEDTGQKAINYRTEPLWKRMQHPPDTPLTETRRLPDWCDVLANAKVGGDPQTPVFHGDPGQPVRFRVLQPGGHARNNVFARARPHRGTRSRTSTNSTRIGRNRLLLLGRGAHGPRADQPLRRPAQERRRRQVRIARRLPLPRPGRIGLDNGLWGILRVQ